MTELCSQRRVEQVNEIIESVQKCEEQMNALMERFKWSKDKLSKVKISTKHIERDDESTETQQHDLANRQTGSMDNQKLRDINSDFPEFGDRNKRIVMSYTDLNKLKRDMRRRRIKHRVTKTAPLTYTEEIRELIAIQMDIEKSSNKTYNK